MSKVAEFMNCVIDGKEYKNKARWEVIDFFIIGFFVIMGGMLLILVDDLSCTMNSYYSDDCNQLKNLVRFFEGLGNE